MEDRQGGGRLPAVEPVKADREPAGGRGGADPADYLEEEGVLKYLHKDGPRIIANFTAKITEHIHRFEIGLERVHYRIMATHSDPAVGGREIVVTAEEYAGMGWAYTLGPDFIMHSFQGAKDHARCGIQAMSRLDPANTIRRIEEYTSLGWLLRGDRYLYLHAGGAIGADGLDADLRVVPQEALRPYRLPDPPDDATRRRAVAAHLDIWSLGHRPGGRAAAAVAATLPFLAVMGPVNFVVHLTGPTGVYKTTLAILVYQYFADVRGLEVALPVMWTSSPTTIQRLLYDCGDAVLVVDDLKRAESIKTAEIMFQDQGNLRGRARARPDQSLQAVLNPRGAVLSTGEVDPETESAKGRALTIEIGKGDLTKEDLTPLQAAGDAGLYRSLMAGYIAWLAPQLDAIRREHERAAAAIYREIEGMPDVHPRHPRMIARLLAGYELFLRFAVEQGDLTGPAARRFAALARRELFAIGAAQAAPQEDAKSGRRFLDLIASLLESGDYHLERVDLNVPPDHPHACGWREDEHYTGRDMGQQKYWHIPARSKKIGYIDYKKMVVYLIPNVAVEAATALTRRLGNQSVSFQKIGRDLLDEGLCLPVREGDDVRADGRHLVQRVRKRFYAIPLEHLINTDTGPEPSPNGEADVEVEVDAMVEEADEMIRAIMAARGPDGPDGPERNGDVGQEEE
jgi:hypothetical protein